MQLESEDKSYTDLEQLSITKKTSSENPNSPYTYDLGLENIRDKSQIYKLSTNQQVRFHA